MSFAFLLQYLMELVMQKKKIHLSSPTMYEDEMKYIKEAFDTN